MQLIGARALGLLVVAILIGGTAGCRDASSDGAIRDTVSRWIEAWTRASGPARDDVAAAEARRALGGELLLRTEGTGSGALREPRAQLLARRYNELVAVAIPPDGGFEVLAVDRDGDTARVSVRLHYSKAAAGAAAAAGLLPFAEIGRLSDLVARPPERVFTVTRVDGEWRIMAIRMG